MLDHVESFFSEHVYGEHESLTRPLWIYGHVSILLATALAGYSSPAGRAS